MSVIEQIDQEELSVEQAIEVMQTPRAPGGAPLRIRVETAAELKRILDAASAENFPLRIVTRDAYLKTLLRNRDNQFHFAVEGRTVRSREIGVEPEMINVANTPHVDPSGDSEDDCVQLTPATNGGSEMTMVGHSNGMPTTDHEAMMGHFADEFKRQQKPKGVWMPDGKTPLVTAQNNRAPTTPSRWSVKGLMSAARNLFSRRKK